MGKEKDSAIYILHKSGVVEIAVSFCKRVGVLNLINYSISMKYIHVTFLLHFNISYLKRFSVQIAQIFMKS